MRSAECGVRSAEKLLAFMNHDNLKKRTKQFALNVISLVESLGNDRVTGVLCRQLIRSSTSVGANYRAACRARSQADFVAKLGIVEEELDESIYWIELLIESGRITSSSVVPLLKEADELLAITVASINTARKAARGVLSATHGAATPRSALRTPHSA